MIIDFINNPISVKPAGSFIISTMNKIGDNYYFVDRSTISESFIPEAGTIKPVGSVDIENP